MYIKHIQTHVSRIHGVERKRETHTVLERKRETHTGVERKRETHTVLRILGDHVGMPQCWCVTTPAVIILALSCHMYVVTCDEN